MCQGLGQNKHDEISEIDRRPSVPSQRAAVARRGLPRDGKESGIIMQSKLFTIVTIIIHYHCSLRNHCAFNVGIIIHYSHRLESNWFCQPLPLGERHALANGKRPRTPEKVSGSSLFSCY